MKNRILSLALVTSISLSSFVETALAADTKLKDIGNHWAKDSIQRLVSNHIISGYPDNSFKPNAPVTKAELVSLLVKAAKLPVKKGNIFPTTFGWSKDAFETAFASGLIKKEDLAKFSKQNEPIKRLDMAILLVRALKLEPLYMNTSPFVDVKNDYLNKAHEQYLLQGERTPSGDFFYPDRTMTRAECAVVLTNVIDYMADPYGFVAKKENEKMNKVVDVQRGEAVDRDAMEKQSANVTKIVQELKSYPIVTDDLIPAKTINEFHAKAEKNPYYQNGFIEWSDTAKTFMELKYNFDYRSVPADYEKNLLYYFGDFITENRKQIHPKDYLSKLVAARKNNKLIVEAKFITSSDLTYTNFEGYNIARGRLFFKYSNGTNLPKGIQVNKWYQQDIEVRTMFSTTRLKITWKTPQSTYRDEKPITTPKLVN